MSERSLLRRPGAGRVVQRITPADAGWDWTTLDVDRLADGDTMSSQGDAAAGRERLLVVLEGRVALTLDGADHGLIGTRDSVFDGPPPALVLAASGVGLSIAAHGPALVALASTPAGALERTAVIDPTSILVERRGEGATERRIHHLLPPSAEAGRLIAFEVFTPGGNWSSWPPHKHDTEEPPTEARLEELYLYRFKRPGAFGFQRVYTPDRSLDQSHAVGDLDVVLVPRGYHPYGAPFGYDAYYLNVMAGPNRAWHFTIDPDHQWLMNWNPAAPKEAE